MVTFKLTIGLDDNYKEYKHHHQYLLQKTDLVHFYMNLNLEFVGLEVVRW